MGIVHHLSAVVGVPAQVGSGDDEGESFETITSGSDSDIYEAEPDKDIVSDHSFCRKHIFTHQIADFA